LEPLEKRLRAAELEPHISHSGSSVLVTVKSHLTKWTEANFL